MPKPMALLLALVIATGSLRAQSVQKLLEAADSLADRDQFTAAATVLEKVLTLQPSEAFGG